MDRGKFNMKYLVFLLIGIFLISFSSGLSELKPAVLDDEYVILQTCATCTYVNITISNNGGLINSNIEMTNNGSGVWIHTFTPTETGRYDVTGVGDKEGLASSFATFFIVNPSGAGYVDGSGFLYVGIILFTFLVACFLLYLSSQMGETGFRIFFMLLAFIFLTGAFFTSYFAVVNLNLGSGMQSLTTTMIIVMLAVVFIIFVWVLIRQTINALDMLKIKKGLKMDTNVGAGSRVGGYNTKRAY